MRQDSELKQNCSKMFALLDYLQNVKCVTNFNKDAIKSYVQSNDNDCQKLTSHMSALVDYCTQYQGAKKS